MKAENVECPQKTLGVRADVNTLLEELQQLCKPAKPSSDPPADDRHATHETAMVVRGK